ncbi:uncharacterized protein LOC144859761 isoform X2 [Branchiostoma floridae x Branchiostoma japonicum]
MATESAVWNWDHTKEALLKLECLLKCGKCGHLLTEPCSLGSCEHLFCRSCVWQDVGNSCPVCDMPAWVRDLQTNRRLATLVSLTGQLRGVLDGKLDVEDNDVEKTGESEEASVDHPGQKTEESSVQNEDMEIQEQELEEVSPEEDHKGVVEEMTDDQPSEQDDIGVTVNMPDDLPLTVSTKTRKTTWKETSQESSAKNLPKGEDIPQLSTPTKDQGKKKATKNQGNSKEKRQLTLRTRTKKSYAEDNDSSESEKEQAEVTTKSPDPLSVFDFHGSPTRNKKSSKKTGKKLKNPAMFNFWPPPSQQGQQRSGQGSGQRSGRRFRRVTKEGLADKNQQWGFSDSGRKKKVERMSSPRKSQLEKLARRVCFAMADDGERHTEPTDEGMKDELVEENTGRKNNEGMEEAKMEGLEEDAETENEGIEEAVMEEPSQVDMSLDEEQAKDSAAYEGTEVSKDVLLVKEKMGKTEEEMPEEHLEGDSQEDGSKEGKEQAVTEVETTSAPEDTEMPRVLNMEEPWGGDTASPFTDSSEETGKKRRRSGRLNVKGKSADKVDTTSGPSSSTKGNTNSSEVCETPKAHNKKRKSPTARKTFLPKEENDSTPLKKVHKKVSMNTDSPKEVKEEGASTSRRKSVEIQDKTGNITKDLSRASLSPVSTPQRRAGSKGRRSSVLTPRGQRSSPRGSPGHVMKRNVRGETLLHLAAIKGDAETVLQLLQEGVDPNVRDNAGWTPLHEASNHGHTRVAEVLLDHGALINTTAFENDSPLHDAVANGRVEVASLLVSRGASLDVRNKLGHLPGDLAVTEAMKEALNTKPLHTQPQVHYVHEENIKDGSRASSSSVSTPQRRAGSKGRRSSILTPRGQRSSPRGSPGHVMKRNKRGETTLHLAAIKGDAETVLQLLQEGVDPNVRDNAGWTPLHEACNHGHTRVAEVLLDHGALINTTAFENDSPLHDAVANGRVEVARLLVSRGASLDVRNKLGHLPGDLAVTEAMKEALNTKPLHTQPQVVMTTSSQVRQVVALATGLDAKQRSALEQCMQVLDGQVVTTFCDHVTHLVAACDDNRRCPRTIKYLRGVLTGKWIVSFKWVSACLEEQQHVPEGPYEVLGTAAKPDSTGARRGRLNKEQQLPGLFDGCHFFLHGKFQPPTPPRKELIELIRAGGGGVLAREPKPDSDCLQASITVAYHARKDSDLAHCSHFILYDEKSAKTPPRIRTAKLCTVPVTWLMDCVTDFSLMELPN